VEVKWSCPILLANVLILWNTDISERQCSRTPNLRHPSAADSRLTNQLRPSSIGDSPLADSVLPRIRKEQQHRFHDDGVSASEVKSASARATCRYVAVVIICCLQLTCELQHLFLRQVSLLRTKGWLSRLSIVNTRPVLLFTNYIRKTAAYMAKCYWGER